MKPYNGTQFTMEEIDERRADRKARAYGPLEGHGKRLAARIAEKVKLQGRNPHA